ncbi:sulfatase [Chthoniobacter flavus Ellin428]|uniref:Sulfatase n=1 Tax=Chthoniobacter flavus Ellin428 TaxID=497964 RepID=B4CZ52_9BACT|nr:sulfatase-like hydrolase/transferase [Chthoniobacter flavus]EDY20743.1 sulfatase [Chthoniobacter flavus Ellin428]TCO89638.1 arylsulfatase A-like enzyme [Chthoniobacter flavus]
MKLLGKLLLALALTANLAFAADRPNILWVVSEDNNPFLGCYGDPLAHTPTLDKLAKEGVLYERCYAWPVCAPSRFTLITGMYPTTCGPAEHMRANGKIPDWLHGFPTYLRQAGYFTSNNAKTDYNSPISIPEAWVDQGKKAHWRNRPDPKQPFFSVFNHEVTHESCLFPEKELPLDFPPMDPAKVRIPAYQPDTPEIRADWARYYNHMTVLDEQIAAKLKMLADDGLADDTIIFYYGDNGGVLPRSKRFLEQSGVSVPLIVYFPPKWRHLAPAAPGSRISDPVSFLDFSETVLSLAGVKIPDYMQGHAFAGNAKAPAIQYVHITRDRMDERYDMMRSISDGHYIYVHNYRPDLPFVQPLEYQFKARGYQSWARVAAEGKLTKDTAQFWGEKPTEELYEMSTDPDSVHNLAKDSKYHDVMARMRAELKRVVLQNKDNGFLPEGSVLEGYEASHKEGAWPVENVYALATKASERDLANLPALLEALEDSSEPMRWWAAQGCTMLGDKASSAAPALRKHLNDDSGAVQVAAAEALARMGQVKEALPTLEKRLQALDTPQFALQAGNVLDRLGEIARPSLPIMKQVQEKVAGNTDAKSYPFYTNRILTHAIAVLEGKTAPLVYPQFSKN